MVVSPLTKYDENDPEFRTSETCFFDGTGIQDYVENKIVKTMGIDKCESSQIQHYRVGNQFKAHYDYFHSDHGLSYLKNGGQRIWTFMVYLNDVEKGGGTNFVSLNYTLYPKKGTAVVWCNLDKDGIPDNKTMHQGLPVEEGEKWIITKLFLQET